MPSWAIALLVGVVLVSFGRLVSCEFLRWDDIYTVALRPDTNPVTHDSWKHAWTDADRTIYIPVTYTVWTALSAIARVTTPDRYGSTLNPMIFHGFNVLAHLASTLLVLAILHRLIRNRTAAIFGALLYAIHPVQVEAVAWVSGLKDLLWGLFSFLAILLYFRFVDRSSRRRWFAYAAGMACVVIAMLCKPTAMMTPLMVIAIDRLLLRRRWRDVALSAGPWLLLSLPCMIVARHMQTGAWINAGPLWARPLIMLDSLAFYVGKLVWPVDLVPDYGHRPATVLASGDLMWTWLVPAVLAGVAIWQRHRRPWIAGGFAIAVLGVLPLLGAVPYSFQFYSTTADHYLYVSMLGLALVAAGMVSQMRRPGRVVLTMVIAAWAIRSIAQEGYWSDTRTLFHHTLAVNPDSFVSELLLAREDMAEGNAFAAVPRLQRAVKLAPDYPRAHRALAGALQALGREDEAMAALEQYALLDQKFPADRRSNLADTYKRLGNYHLRKRNHSKAAQMFAFALEENPADIDASFGLLKATEAASIQP
jgi:hypothetical protein